MALDLPVSEYPKQQTPYEHYRDAERLLTHAAQLREEHTEMMEFDPADGAESYPYMNDRWAREVDHDIMTALVHATLATARKE